MCQIAVPAGGLAPILDAIAATPDKSLLERVRDELSTNVVVSEHGAGASTPS